MYSQSITVGIHIQTDTPYSMKRFGDQMVNLAKKKRLSDTHHTEQLGPKHV